MPLPASCSSSSSSSFNAFLDLLLDDFFFSFFSLKSSSLKSSFDLLFCCLVEDLDDDFFVDLLVFIEDLSELDNFSRNSKSSLVSLNWLELESLNWLLFVSSSYEPNELLSLTFNLDWKSSSKFDDNDSFFLVFFTWLFVILVFSSLSLLSFLQIKYY